MSRRPRPAPAGFTLIEVLVALTILAVALTAAMRAASCGAAGRADGCSDTSAGRNS
ncbi:UNVERIFIED_CONTAM: prepilin-type N-terminal cleavage/methylation domain-containing protein [Microbacterium sp. SLM126]